MATAERESLRLEGPLAVVARELGIGVWNDETRSITVPADRTDEARNQLNEIARGGSILRAQSTGGRPDDLTDEQLVQHLALIFGMCLDRLAVQATIGGGCYGEEDPEPDRLVAGLALAAQLTALTDAFISGMQPDSDVDLLGWHAGSVERPVSLDHLKGELVEALLDLQLPMAEFARSGA